MRCTGHCCRRFALEKDIPSMLKELESLKKKALQSPRSSQSLALKKEISDLTLISQMVIPLTQSKNGEEFLYTCKNLKSDGNCGIYEIRPQMCRDFPEPKGCHFWRCTSDQSAYYEMSWLKKVITRYKWLRKLGRHTVLP